MKRLQAFLQEKPSYTKCSSAKIAEMTKLSINTVERFKKTAEYKAIKSSYLNR